MPVYEREFEAEEGVATVTIEIDESDSGGVRGD
jgi:hypothetical protein